MIDYSLVYKNPHARGDFFYFNSLKINGLPCLSINFVPLYQKITPLLIYNLLKMKSLRRFIGEGKTLILLFAMIALLAPARMMGQENTLTVYDEDLVNNEYVPIYGVCTDRHLKAEFVMPSSKLADMAYNAMFSMKFYSSSSQATWEGIVFHVFLMEVEEPTINSFYGMDNATVVYEGPLSISGNEMVVDFTKPYYYQGGHLLIGFYNTTNGASYWACQWKGETVEGASVQGVGYTDMNSITPTQRNFLPKTTFTYEPENPDCLRPYALTVNNVEARSAVLSWTPGSAEQDQWEFYYTNTMPTVAPDDNTTPNLVNITTNPYTWTGLASEATYYVYVRSNCGAGGVSKWSKMASFTTPPTCIAPTGLAASNVGSTTASLSWTPGVEGQELWEVYLTIDANDIPDASTTPTHPNLESTSLDLTDLVPEYTYYAYVRANCGSEDGVSAWSPVCSFKPTETTQLTVHDGTETNIVVPLRGGAVKNYCRSEFVIPAEELSGMTGKYISSMKFYGDQSTTSWINTVTFDVFMKMVDFTQFNSASCSGQEGATVVYQGKMKFNSSKEMTVTFTTPFYYEGGNLLVGFYSTKTTSSYNAQAVNWKSEMMTTYTAVSGTGSSLTGSFSYSLSTYLPKTTFTYSDMLAPIYLRMISVWTNTAVMRWSPDPAYTGTITGYEVVYSTEASFNPYAATALSVTLEGETSIGLSGLSSNTQYYAYVRAKNGDVHGPWSECFTFRTAEFNPAAINDDNPYYYDGFDGETFEWSTANGANHWMRGYGTRKSPSYSMYVSCNQSCIINLGYTTDSYVYKTFDLEGGKEYEISFNWKFKPLHTTQDYFKVYLVPAGTVFEANVVTPVASDWIALDGGSTLVGESKYTWYDCYNTFEIPEGQGGSYMVVFRWHNDNYGSSSNSFWDNVVAIDNLLFNVYMGEAPRPMPQEPEPTEVTLEMETPEVEPDYWQIIYSTDPDLDPYTLDLSEFPDNLPEGVVGVETTDAQPKLEGLDPETGYYVYVRAVYPDIKKDGEPNWLYTRWSEQVSFTTGISCYVVNSIQPTAIAADNATLTWTTDPQQGNANMPQTWNVKYKKEIQAGVETTYDFENGQNPAVYMEGWTVSEGSLTSVGYLENTAAIFPVQLPCSIEFDAKALVEASLRVSVCSDPQGQYQDGVMTRTVTEGEYQHFTVNFAGYEGTKYLMFSTIYKAPVSIDNLTLDVPVWTTGTANGNTFTINGLEPQTDYLFAVQAHCGEGDDSQWETTLFRTQYGNMEVPYEENFDTYSNGDIPDGWSVINNGQFPIIVNDFYHSLGYSLALYSTGEGDQYAIMPPVENVSSLQMEFWSATPLVQFGQTTFAIGVMTDPEDVKTFEPVKTFTTTPDWTKNVVYFDQYEGQGQYIAIQLVGAVDTGKLLAIDDIEVSEAPSCFLPEALTVTDITASSAVVSWTPSGGEMQWNLSIKDMSAPGAPAVMGFEDGVMPTDWLYENVNVFEDASNAYEGDWCLKPTAGGGVFVIPVAFGNSVSFYVKAMGEETDYNVMLNTGADWQVLYSGTATTSYELQTIDLSAYSGAGMIGFDIPEGIVMDNITLPGEPDWGQPVLVENTPSYTFDNLSLGTSYEVRVQAVCAVDDVSDWVETQFNTPLCASENQCAITYIIGDDYGDGWTGNTINIVEAASGIVVASITMEDHNVAGQYVEDSGTLPLCPGSYDFVWVSGEWADECSFILYDPNGNEIVSFESGKSGPEPGSLLETPYQHTCEGVPHELEVVGYGDSEGGYYLIASPVTVDPDDVEGMTDGSFDLYWFDQTAADGKEWRNYEAEGVHFDLVPGMGYLYAHDTDVTLVFDGEPYEGDGSVSLVKDDEAHFAGWNLVGNPFGVTAYIDRDYYVLNSEGSELTAGEGNEIAPMQGIFVVAESDGEELLFSTEAPSGGGSKIVMNVTRNCGGVIDRAMVRLGEGRTLPKFQLNPNSTKVFIPQGMNDYAVVSSANEGEMPVSFKAAKDGNYTIAINVEGVEASYLHLIDNLTGVDVDLLTTPSYSFEARTTDYASRFKLVFVCGDANDDNDFVYFNGSKWVVNNIGNATLQVVDVTGRVLSSETIDGNASINVDATPGIYMMRLVNGENVKVQKIVVR